MNLLRTFIRRLINYKNLKLKNSWKNRNNLKKKIASLKKRKRHTLTSWTNTVQLKLLQLIKVGMTRSASSCWIPNLFSWCFLKAGSMATTMRRHSSTTVSRRKMDKKRSTRNSWPSFAISYCKNGQPSTREKLKKCASRICRTLRPRLFAIASSTTSSNSTARLLSETFMMDWSIVSKSVGKWRGLVTQMMFGIKQESSNHIATYFCLLGA